MADSKITDLTSGNPAQSGDEIPINRSGADRKVTAASIAALTTGVSDGDKGDVVVSGSGTVWTVESVGGTAISLPLPVASGGTGQTTAAEALGEMIQALTADASPDTAADYVATYDASADTGKKVLLSSIASSGGRTRLTGNDTIHVRTDSADVTSISIASPAVVTKTAHGLQADDPVVFSVDTNRQDVTCSLANPAVITKASHGFAIGDAVNFRSTGALPANLDGRIINSDGDIRNYAMATYYIIATGFTTGAFQVSLTPGGSAVSTAAQSQSGTHTCERARIIKLGTATFATTVVTCANHGLVAGQEIVFATTGALPDTLPDPGEGGNSYGYRSPYGSESYVPLLVKTVLSANTFNMRTVESATTLDVSGAASGTHTLFRFSPLPVGMIEGEIYYVIAAGLTADTFSFADIATDASPLGGVTVNTTGTQVGVVQYQTGNDANDGSASTRAGAMLTLQAAYEYVRDSIDGGGNEVSIRLHRGTYYAADNLLNTQDNSNLAYVRGPGWLDCYLKIEGDSGNKSRVRFVSRYDSGDSFAIGVSFSSFLEINDVEWHNPTFCAINCFGSDAEIRLGNCAVSGVNGDDPHFLIQGGVTLYMFQGTMDVLWGAGTAVGASGGALRGSHLFNLSGGKRPSGFFGSASTIRLFHDPYFGTILPGTHHPDNSEFYRGGLITMNNGSKFTCASMTWTGTYTGGQGQMVGPDATFEDRDQAVPGATLLYAYGGGESDWYISGSNWYTSYGRLNQWDELHTEALDLGNQVSDCTLARSGAGDFTVEGNAVYRAGGTDVPVTDGGTGRSTSTTAYGLLAAGTTATGAHQTLAAGATTEILVGGGASALPVWTTAQGSGAPVRATSPALTTPTVVTSINPSSNDSASLGVTATRFSDLFMADGAVIDLGTTSSRATITHTAASDSLVIAADPNNATASSTITLQVDGTTEVVLDATNFAPGANDGNALGVSGTAWSDLFLASGALINFAAGNAVITHSSGVINVSTGALQVGGTAVALQGKKTLWIGAGAMQSRTTNGSQNTAREINSITVGVQAFDTTTSEGACFNVAFPKAWNAGTVTYEAYWTAASGSGTAIFSLRGGGFANDAAINSTGYGTGVTVTDTLLSANDVHISPTSAAVTIANAAADTLTFFELTRDVSDTLGVDAELIGIKFYYTTNAGNDA